MAKIWKLQDGREVIPWLRSLMAYSPAPFVGIEGAPCGFEEKKKLVVPADHRLCDRDLIDPEELALETLPTIIGSVGGDPFR